MSIGDLKTEGNKGNNFPWQLRMLMGQQCACDELTAIAGNTDNVEFLLTAILTSLQDGTEYEAKFVTDTCDSDKIYLEVRVWDTDSGTWGPITYYVPGSSVAVVPVGFGTPGCLQFADPTGVLGMILAAIQAQTLILNSIDAGTAAALGQTTMVNSVPVVIASDQTAVPVTLSGGGAQVLTSSIEVAGGSVTAGAAVVSFVTSVGFTGTINGIARTASTQYVFEASPSKTLPAIPYTITAGSIELDKLV
jgi:hypothetical protein